MTVFAGYYAYDAFLLGAKGWVSVSGNFMPRLSAQLFEVTVEQEDLVAGLALYDRMLPLINATDGYIARTKAALDLVGMPSGRPRAPRLPASDEDIGMLRAMLGEIGVLADKAA
jgi:4-hydroxy-tetrahydrodipicolinate synthase